MLRLKHVGPDILNIINQHKKKQKKNRHNMHYDVLIVNHRKTETYYFVKYFIALTN